MAKAGWGMIWATAEDLVQSRPVVLSLHRKILRALNSLVLPLGHAAWLAKKAECRAIFIFGPKERSIHNIWASLTQCATPSASSTAAASP